MNDITVLAQRMKQQATLANGFLYVETSNVLALVEALEKAQQRIGELEKATTEPVAWTEKCEITNMQATGLYLRGFPDNSQGRDIALYTVPPALESRTVTVKLPPRVDISNVPFTAHTWNCCLDAVEKCLSAAGIQVIEGES